MKTIMLVAASMITIMFAPSANAQSSVPPVPVPAAPELDRWQFDKDDDGSIDYDMDLAKDTDGDGKIDEFVVGTTSYEWTGTYFASQDATNLSCYYFYDNGDGTYDYEKKVGSTVVESGRLK